MRFLNRPHFVVKNDLQKSRTTGEYFGDHVTPDILRDVARRITGSADCTYEYVGKEYSDDFLAATYNKGRMAIMYYRDTVYFISFSELNVGGRNSSVQSVPTAFNIFYNCPYRQKRLFYYFLHANGNLETDYQILMYRLMKTIGFEFLNAENALARPVVAFNSIEDIISFRGLNAGRNKSNNSTFITKSSASSIDIYGKTYGANKYETSMMCYALSTLWQENQEITLYEVLENDLKELPRSSLDVLNDMGIIQIVPTDMTLEKRVFDGNLRLRSPRYIFNLAEKFGQKHCALCDCEIPELIQGAHIWPVSEIRMEHTLTPEEKLRCSIDGENGLWLCENHHKMFDEGLLKFNENGDVLFANGLRGRDLKYMHDVTPVATLPEFILTDQFLEYLWRRNRVA